MEEIKTLIELRRKIKKNKPNFLRQEAHKIKGLKKGPKWRAPKGMHSKMRRKLKGRRKQPTLGYGSPRQVRGLTPEGFKQVLVHNINEIKDNKGIIISKRVGLRKKLLILKKAQELKIKVLNVKDIAKFISSAEEKLKLKKSKSKKKEEKKKATKEELLKKAEEKKKEEEKQETPEEKEKREKEEKRKVLEQK